MEAWPINVTGHLCGCHGLTAARLRSTFWTHVQGVAETSSTLQGPHLGGMGILPPGSDPPSEGPTRDSADIKWTPTPPPWAVPSKPQGVLPEAAVGPGGQAHSCWTSGPSLPGPRWAWPFAAAVICSSCCYWVPFWLLLIFNI